MSESQTTANSYSIVPESATERFRRMLTILHFGGNVDELLLESTRVASEKEHAAHVLILSD